MVMRIVAAIGIGLLFAGSAVAQTPRVAVPDRLSPLVLVDHDDRHDHGRHLGWYKHRGHDDDDADNEEGRWDQRRRGMYPGYGSSYPPGAYGGYGSGAYGGYGSGAYRGYGYGYQPPYYRGY